MEIEEELKNLAKTAPPQHKYNINQEGQDSAPDLPPAEEIEESALKDSGEDFSQLFETIEGEINACIRNCNNMEQSHKKLLEKINILGEDFEKMRAQKGDTSLLYQLVSLLSASSGNLLQNKGRIDNIRFSMLRIQNLIEDKKDSD